MTFDRQEILNPTFCSRPIVQASKLICGGSHLKQLLFLNHILHIEQIHIDNQISGGCIGDIGIPNFYPNPFPFTMTHCINFSCIGTKRDNGFSSHLNLQGVHLKLGFFFHIKVDNFFPQGLLIIWMNTEIDVVIYHLGIFCQRGIGDVGIECRMELFHTVLGGVV